VRRRQAGRRAEGEGGTAATFDQARSDFEEAWRVFSARRTPADYQAWRDQRDWTERKHAIWERGERLSVWPRQPSRRPQKNGPSSGEAGAAF
jgi:hypothetical protein